MFDDVQVGLPTAINNTFVGERTGNPSDVGGAFNIYSDASCVNMFTTNDQANDPTITSSGIVCEGEDFGFIWLLYSRKIFKLVLNIGSTLVLC